MAPSPPAAAVLAVVLLLVAPAAAWAPAAAPPQADLGCGIFPGDFLIGCDNAKLINDTLNGVTDAVRCLAFGTDCP